MDIKQLVSSLSPNERKILPFLDSCNNPKCLSEKSGLDELSVMRSLQWLENKGVLNIKKELKEKIILGKNGEKYKKIGLPEMVLLKSLKKEHQSIEILLKKSGIEKDELNICIGTLKSKAAVDIKKDGGLEIAILPNGEKILKSSSLEEKFLQKEFPIDLESLKPEEKLAFENLKKRKDIINIEKTNLRTYELSETGKKLSKEKVSGEFIEKLTPQMLRDGSWKGKSFRRYDVKINVPKVSYGKKQPYRSFLDYTRKKMMSLGFKEMFGPIVESEFWDMDALFMPQFHSARNIHDAYYIKDPKVAKLDPELVDKVRKAHENGFNTGSKGWKYKFDVNKTKKLILRTQTTACSARMLTSKELKIPGKYFAIAKCFRPDVIDSTHLADFMQIEGIVVEDGLNFTHLKGLLKMFAEKFANAEKIKIVPAYFPFTEPSAELYAKHPEMGWIEIGGSGIFRPELTKPLGIDVPVLAWGLGIDRIAMFKLGIKDIRDLYSSDLDFLRKSKIFLE